MKKVALSAVLFAVGALMFVLLARTLTKPLPEPIAVDVRIPMGAEVQPAERVHPGTFRVEQTEEEILARAEKTGGLIVVYPRADYPVTPISVEYWLPRGDGVFYHASRLVLKDEHATGWGTAFTPRDTEFAGSRLTIHPRRSYFILFGFGFMGAFAVFAGIVFSIDPIQAYWKRKQSARSK